MADNKQWINENTARIEALAKRLEKATYTDVSDTTATASDVATGKVFYDKDGKKTEGSAISSSVTIITEYIDESSLPQNPKENDVCILNASDLRTWVYQNGAWIEYPVLIEEEINEAGGTTLVITNNAVKEISNDAGGTTLIIGG